MPSPQTRSGSALIADHGMYQPIPTSEPCPTLAAASAFERFVYEGMFQHGFRGATWGHKVFIFTRVSRRLASDFWPIQPKTTKLSAKGPRFQLKPVSEPQDTLSEICA